MNKDGNLTLCIEEITETKKTKQSYLQKKKND